MDNYKLEKNSETNLVDLQTLQPQHSSICFNMNSNTIYSLFIILILIPITFCGQIIQDNFKFCTFNGNNRQLVKSKCNENKIDNFFSSGTYYLLE